MRHSWLILLSLTGILLAVILLTEKEVPEGQGKRLFSWSAGELREIHYQGTMRHRDREIPIRYVLFRKKANLPQEKPILHAEVFETDPQNSEVTQVVRFALGSLANVYFEELHKLTAFYTLPEDEKTRQEIGFHHCDKRLSFLRGTSQTEEVVFCLGPLTYNQARQYIWQPGKAIYLTYRHVWQRYENSIYSLADKRLIPESDLYNRLEISFAKQVAPRLFEQLAGKLVLKPRRQAVGVEREKETIVWEFDKETLPVPLASRLQATLEALRLSYLLRAPDLSFPKESPLAIRLSRLDKNHIEQTVRQIRLFPPTQKWPQLLALEGQVVKPGSSWFIDNQQGFGLLQKEEVQKLLTILQELEKQLASPTH